MTLDEFTGEFKMLAEVYGQNPSNLMCAGYYAVLKDLTKEEFSDAVIKIIKSSKYFPKPVELINVTRLRVYTKAELWE